MVRRLRGEDSVSFDHRGPCTDTERHRKCPGRWRAEVSLGYAASGKRVKKKVTARTKTELLDKLKDLRDDIGSGVTDRTVTVRQAIDAWLDEGLDGRSPVTVARNRNLFYSRTTPDQLRPEFADISARKLRELNASS